jgi:hypothetical protein
MCPSPCRRWPRSATCRKRNDFVEFAERAAMDETSGGHDPKLMYDLHGGRPEEEELSHLEGYRGSTPVRIGNGARSQRQHDVYGELLDCAYELVRRGESLEPEIAPLPGPARRSGLRDGVTSRITASGKSAATRRTTPTRS